MGERHWLDDDTVPVPDEHLERVAGKRDAGGVWVPRAARELLAARREIERLRVEVARLESHHFDARRVLGALPGEPTVTAAERVARGGAYSRGAQDMRARAAEACAQAAREAEERAMAERPPDDYEYVRLAEQADALAETIRALSSDAPEES